MSTAMDIDSPHPSLAANGLSKHLGGVVPPTARITDVIEKFRPTKLIKREGKPHILSLDFDDPGELLLTSESDESIYVYNVKDATKAKSALSKKYGVKLAKFTRASTSIVYASQKENDTLRLLSTHDNSYIRYFSGHTASVTSIAMHPGKDTFFSCSVDDTVRLWDLNTPNHVGQLYLKSPFLAAFDPSANVFAVASPLAQTILLYDYRKFSQAPFATFDTLPFNTDTARPNTDWTKLEFSNDGKNILVGTTGKSHFLIDAFTGELKAHLWREQGGARRLAAGMDEKAGGREEGFETTGDACFSPDGRYVVSGKRGEGVCVYDTMGSADEKGRMRPVLELDCQREAAVMAFNPRYNFFATAGQEVVFWVPDMNL